MARSVGEAAATGLEAGFRMARDVRNDEDRKAERKVEQDRLQSAENFRESEAVQNRMRQTKLDERQDVEYQNQAAQQENAAASTDFSTAIAQYGSFDKAPPELQAKLTKQAQSAGSAVDSAQSRRRELMADQARQRGADIFSNLQAGRLKLDDVRPADLYMALTTQLGRNPNDLIGQDGQPSKLAQAVGDVTTGIETGNNGMLLRGSNVLFAPTLQKGVGGPSPYGGTIIGKEIIGMIPHPQNPGLVSPVVRVYVNNGKAEASGDEIRARRSGMPEGAPAGATGHYDAPITQNRSTDPNDPIKFIDMGQALDHVGQMGVLTEMLNHPEIRAKYEEGKAQAGTQANEWLELYKARGLQAQPKVTQRKVDLGDRVELEDVDARGRPVSGSQRTLQKGAPPRNFAPGRMETNIQAIQDYADENGISFEEAAGVMQANGLTRPKPRAAGLGGAGGAGGGKISAAEMKRIGDEAENTIARDMGLVKDKGKWLGKNGQPADPDMIGRLAAGRYAALKKADEDIAGGKRPNGTAATDAARNTQPPAAPPSKFTVGTVYANASGQKAKYGGRDPAGKDIWLKP